MNMTELMVTEEEYALLQTFKKEQRQEEIRESQNSVLNLIDDIDEPIRKTVAMLNLLGISTKWACCGFDYPNQPKHKTHEYGNVYFRCIASLDSFKVILAILQYNNPIHIGVFGRNPWRVELYNIGGVVEFQIKYYGNVEWKNNQSWYHPSSVHFHEMPNCAITILNHALLSLKNLFMDSVTICDQNSLYQQRQENWSYPAKQPWIVTKEYVF